jgi:hypothetical protein
VGEVLEGIDPPVEVCSLVERFGRDRAMLDPLTCVEEVVAERLGRAGMERPA